jgi:hypothetical protein
MKHPLAFTLFSLLLALPASAEEKVIFFGGSMSQKAVLDRCFPGFVNSGYPAGNNVQAAIDEIRAHPENHYTVVGHSSGAKYANLVVGSVVRGFKGNRRQAPAAPVDPSQVTLIDLDGYAPDGVPKSVPRRVCWHAQGGVSGKIKSRNYSSMSPDRNCTEVHTYQDNHCKTVWCMHFTVVNPQTPDLLGSGYYVKGGKGRKGRFVSEPWYTDGYNGCSQASLPWLQK